MENVMEEKVPTQYEEDVIDVGLKADGSVVTRETADSGFFAFGDRALMNARVEPGDSILVPEKLVQTRFMKDVKDITQILYQIAVTAGVLLVVF